MTRTACLEENTLAALGEGRLTPSEREAAVRHIDDCEDCRRLLAVLGHAEESLHAAPGRKQAGEPDESKEVVKPLAPGNKLGRYMILHPVGTGGMGVVYAAYDSHLDRRVALKLLRPDRLPGSGSSADETRLLREAQALAQLSHPHVVSVFDAGKVEGQVFVAMEFVEGGTLGTWLREQKRTPEEILESFVGAGRGLAAAHAAGFVHRDFKPDNVLVGRDGRVRVTDFGLVRNAGAVPPAASGHELTHPAGSLTRTGALLGTPAYMAPEQWRGEPADARSDQFSFCVALYEALYGERPYTVAEVSAKDGPPRPPAPPAGVTRVPEWVRRPLLRGLAPEPGSRFPSMGSLLEELERGKGVSGRRRVGMGLAAGVLGLAVVGGVMLRDDPGKACRGAEQRLVGAWDPARRERVGAAFLATGTPYAQDAWKATQTLLDRYADGWVAMHTDACEATHVRGEQSGELLDLRMQCLAQRREGLKALVDVLATADAKLVETATRAVSALPPLDECASAAALTAPVRPPADPTTRAKVDAVRVKLAEVEAQRAAGRPTEGRKLVQQAMDEARALAYRPLEAEALLALGRLDQGEDARKAEDELQTAVWTAVAGGHDQVAAEAAISLVQFIGRGLRHHEQGHQWSQFAQAVLQRLGGVPSLEASRLTHLGQLLSDEGRSTEAMEYLQQALALREKLLGPEHPDVAEALSDLATVELAQERLADALQHARRAVEINEKLLGPHHPQVGQALFTLTYVMVTAGKAAEALPYIQRNLSIAEAAYGPEHTVTADALTAVANTLTVLERNTEAVQLYERALAIHERISGPESEAAAAVHTNIGLAYSHLGDYAKDVLHGKRALAIHEKTLAPDHPDLANDAYGIGKAYYEMKDYPQALPYFERALAIAEKHALTDDVVVGRYLRTRITRFLAEVLWVTGRDKPRARKLIVQTVELLRGGGDAMRSDAEEMEAWLATHPL
ncbi:tetratricopeptide repeat protein [Vitiosangium sp. GDMCC 1.1324]|uniref:serine/threonine-protein kinase n=1 Tax=Vitiosangium sp. (strain GDMCC 1.1324) TaxID=2138576 RepID=UPI00130D4AE9|nr:serine/threonine-protein kinase [Vitiosangium sp. GDMCC 1.1324]